MHEESVPQRGLRAGDSINGRPVGGGGPCTSAVEDGNAVMALRKPDACSSLGTSADGLCRGMGASQYKDYVLMLLFVKYVSDKAKAHSNSLIACPGGSFDDFAALNGKSNIGGQMNAAMCEFARAND